ncbi:MAG: hypothetical protein Q8R97_04605, partial [Brevundimonas sp.]|nr:hypothetical protein [Brevundimonas sp.]
GGRAGRSMGEDAARGFAGHGTAAPSTTCGGPPPHQDGEEMSFYRLNRLNRLNGLDCVSVP